MTNENTSCYKIKSTGEYAITKDYLPKEGVYYQTDYFILDKNKFPQRDYDRIRGMLIGYDPTEPPDSPYAIGNTDIMDNIVELPEEEFFKQSGADSELIKSVISAKERE